MISTVESIGASGINGNSTSIGGFIHFLTSVQLKGVKVVLAFVVSHDVRKKRIKEET